MRDGVAEESGREMLEPAEIGVASVVSSAATQMLERLASRVLSRAASQVLRRAVLLRALSQMLERRRPDALDARPSAIVEPRSFASSV